MHIPLRSLPVRSASTGSIADSSRCRSLMISIYNATHYCLPSHLSRDTMKHTATRALFAATLITLPLASAHAFELAHSKGVVKLDATPQRVVSFDLGTLDTLAALDVPVAGVPRSTYEGALARYKDKPVVGTLFEPDYAALKEIRPDLIVAGRRSLPAVPELEKLAPTVDFMPDLLNFMAHFRDT